MEMTLQLFCKSKYNFFFMFISIYNVISQLSASHKLTLPAANAILQRISCFQHIYYLTKMDSVLKSETVPWKFMQNVEALSCLTNIDDCLTCTWLLTHFALIVDICWFESHKDSVERNTVTVIPYSPPFTTPPQLEALKKWLKTWSTYTSPSVGAVTLPHKYTKTNTQTKNTAWPCSSQMLILNIVPRKRRGLSGLGVGRRQHGLDEMCVLLAIHQSQDDILKLLHSGTWFYVYIYFS